MNSKVYKWCAVPQCVNTSIKTPNKLFAYVPQNKTIRSKWLSLARRDSASVGPNTHICFCEDHFDLPNDMENFMEYHVMGSVSQVRMKPKCVPTKFECQSDKRKRLSDTEEKPNKRKKQRKLLKDENEKDLELTSDVTNHLDVGELPCDDRQVSSPGKSILSNLRSSLTEDYRLDEEEPDTSPSPLLFCICCLEGDLPFIYFLTCCHGDFLNDFVMPEIKPKNQVVCYRCHEMLKKIKLFKMQVEKSFKMLSESTEVAQKCSIQKQHLEIHQVSIIDIEQEENTEKPQTTPEPKIEIEVTIKRENEYYIDDTEISSQPNSFQNKANENIENIEEGEMDKSNIESIDDTKNSSRPNSLLHDANKNIKDTEYDKIDLEITIKKEVDSIDDTENSFQPKSLQVTANKSNKNMKNVVEDEKDVEVAIKKEFESIDVLGNSPQDRANESDKNIENIEVDLEVSIKKKIASINHTENSSQPNSLQVKANKSNKNKKIVVEDDIDKTVTIKKGIGSIEDTKNSSQPNTLHTTTRKNIEDALKIINSNQNSGHLNFLASSLQTLSHSLFSDVYNNVELGNTTIGTISSILNSDIPKSKNMTISEIKNSGDIVIKESIKNERSVNKKSVENVSNEECLADNNFSKCVMMNEQSRIVGTNATLDLNIKQVTLTKEQLMENRDKAACSRAYLRAPHRCKSCLIGFQFQENLEDHVKRKHTDLGKGFPQCEICLQYVDPGASNDMHKLWHYTRYECLVCRQQFATYDNAVFHYRKHHRNCNVKSSVLYHCQHCEYKTGRKILLKKHLNVGAKCKLCGVEFLCDGDICNHKEVCIEATSRTKRAKVA